MDQPANDSSLPTLSLPTQRSPRPHPVPDPTKGPVQDDGVVQEEKRRKREVSEDSRRKKIKVGRKLKY